ncbi:dihydroneopterin aldolase family protein [Halosegnis marinus]|uniref:Dihydroneopterin aldolase n=1 Tax=Halosegnis marinus TaxID=3034023 RepID=A0ABD5ZPE4_9EURY|nr:dihydroneopterin aldolase family protein [Halosegnis sp. DT85]
MDPTDPEAACFEAGIKFGSLYHQFAGTPVSPESTDSLERAMAEAIENQPYCESVTVEIHEERVRDAIDHAEAYTELTGALMDVDMTVDYDGVVVHTEMRMADGYPRMRVVDVSDKR